MTNFQTVLLLTGIGLSYIPVIYITWAIFKWVYGVGEDD
jgi:hypothetical protein